MTESHDEIMQQRIVEYNKLIMTLDISQMPIGLFDGLMGICIYFYYQGHYYQERKYYKFAERLLDIATTNISEDMEIDFSKGLTGICFGIQYLIKNKFIKGNSNNILKELEGKLYRDTWSHFLLTPSKELNADEIQAIVFVSLYFCERLHDKKMHRHERFIYQNFIIHCINKIEDISFLEKYTEPFVFLPIKYFLPLYLTLLSKAYPLEFYNYKIDRIWNEMHERILKMYPYLQSNRLFLGLSMKLANQYYKNNEWENHIALLLNQSNSNYVIESEFLNKNILMNNGLTGLYYVLKQYRHETTLQKEPFCQKIIQSELWDEVLIQDWHLSSLYTSLAYGLMGVILAYQDYNYNQQIIN